MTGQSWTPGRVNLMGEWIDFNGGLVLPAALPLGVNITLEAIDSALDEVSSAQFDGIARADMNIAASGAWADYVFGALQAARREGWLSGAARVHLDSDIPPGAGVSSSAAVTVGVLKAAAPAGTDLTQIACLARAVENDFIGVPCGIMDQMAVAHAAPGEAIALDTDSLAFERISLPAGWRLAVIHSGVKRRLADGQYRERREACRAAADWLQVEALCHAPDIAGLPDHLIGVARHVVSEHQRTLAAVEALRAGDADALGALMTQTHRSLRDDFRNSTSQVDAVVDTVLAAGASGARMTGAGFGGCIVALLTPDTPTGFREHVLSAHPLARWVCEVEALNDRMESTP